MKASLKNYRQSPRKTRLVADAVRGKEVQKALTSLTFLEKRAADAVQKLLQSAVANALQEGKKEENLFVKSVTVDKGVTYKRFMPRARGSASRINKRTSNIAITLGERS